MLYFWKKIQRFDDISLGEFPVFPLAKGGCFEGLSCVIDVQKDLRPYLNKWLFIWIYFFRSTRSNRLVRITKAFSWCFTEFIWGSQKPRIYSLKTSKIFIDAGNATLKPTINLNHSPNTIWPDNTQTRFTWFYRYFPDSHCHNPHFTYICH